MIASVVKSLEVQWTIVIAIVMREIQTKYAKSRLGYLMAVIEPSLMMGSMLVIRFFFRGQHARHGIPPMLLVLSGFLVFFAFRSAVMNTSGATQQTSAMLIFPRVTVLDAIFARCILSWFTFICVMTVISASAMFLLNLDPPKELGLAIFCVTMGMWMGSGLGLILGVIIRYFPVVAYGMNGILRILTYTSGVFFTADELPQKALAYMAWNPVFHICELMRQAWIPIYISPVADMWYVLLWVLMLTFFGLGMERMSRHFKFT